MEIGGRTQSDLMIDLHHVELWREVSYSLYMSLVSLLSYCGNTSNCNRQNDLRDIEQFNLSQKYVEERFLRDLGIFAGLLELLRKEKQHPTPR